MNRSSFAFLVALIIHILLLLLFWILGALYPDAKPIQKDEKRMKISLKEMPKKHKKSGDTKKIIQPSSIAPPMPKGSQLKKIQEKPPMKQPKIIPKKPPIKSKPKELVKKIEHKPKVKVKPLVQKPYIVVKDYNKTKKSKEKEKQKTIDPLYAILSQDKSKQEDTQKESKKHSGSSISQDVKELYGDEFGKLTQGQQKYILDNQEIMRRITQEILTRVASVNIKSNLNVNRSNVIEFYLHPNGDMTDFKFLDKSGYYILDNTTKETISYAYSRYPRPTETTLIRYNVFYNLARY